MADELDVMATFIVDRLKASAPITALVGSGSAARIYQDVAPQNATMPYIVFASLAPNDVSAVGAVRIATRDQWLVKAVIQASSFGGNLTTLADAINTQLHGDSGLSGVASGGRVVHSYRARPFRLSETNNGIAYRWKGAIFNIMAQVT